MNFRVVWKLLGLLILSVAVNQIFSVICAALYREWEAAACLMLSLILAGGVGYWIFRRHRDTTEEMYRKEALAVVGLGWLTIGVVGALPYWLYGLARFYIHDTVHPFLSPIDCYFESLSGFSTTGATILSEIEALPRGILFWRSYTHWLGGMGIIVLFVAILPYLGAGGKQLFRSEVTGPVKEGLRPRIQESAALLWFTYLLFTVVETIALMFCGMDLFDALCHTFGTLATGGFSTKNASVAFFHASPEYNGFMIDMVITAFMVAAGVNFSLHFALWRHGDWRTMVGNQEFRWFIGIVAVVTGIITLDLGANYAHHDLHSGYSTFGHWARSFQLASFQTASILTTTGFATGDWSVWPILSKIILVMLMFVGGCAGSTGGGMKVIRVVLLFQTALHHLESAFRPRVVRRMRSGGQVIGDDLQFGVLTYFVLCVLILIVSFLFLALMGYDMETTVTASISALFNIGPGLGKVYAFGNYAFFDPLSKLWLTLLMVAGRLELYSIIVLFVPSFWRVH